MPRTLPRPDADPRGPHLAAVLLLGVLAAAPSYSRQEQTPGPDGAVQAEAAALASRVVDSMGGQQRWDAARLLRFDFTSRRDGATGTVYRHWWDRQTGDYRLEGSDREGRAYRALFDLDTRQGRAWREGRELAGEELAALLETAYGRFINDSYWLLMPWKWRDPGVDLDYEGKRQVDGREYEVVRLSFGSGVGLTSNDRYWAFVDPATARVARWAYVLQDEQGAPGTGEPTVWAWEDWTKTAAGIELATVRRRVGGPDVQILFPVAEAWSEPTAEQLREAFSPAPPASP
jgi:hypothetical protein